MGIDKFEFFLKKLNKILDDLDSFCASIEIESRSSNSENDKIVQKIKRIETSNEDDGKATKEKTITFLYNHSISFIRTNKVKGDFPISVKF